MGHRNLACKMPIPQKWILQPSIITNCPWWHSEPTNQWQILVNSSTFTRSNPAPQKDSISHSFSSYRVFLFMSFLCKHILFVFSPSELFSTTPKIHQCCKSSPTFILYKVFLTLYPTPDTENHPFNMWQNLHFYRLQPKYSPCNGERGD